MAINLGIWVSGDNVTNDYAIIGIENIIDI
jgi:hypothetical protein